MGMMESAASGAANAANSAASAAGSVLGSFFSAVARFGSSVLGGLWGLLSSFFAWLLWLGKEAAETIQKLIRSNYHQVAGETLPYDTDDTAPKYSEFHWLAKALLFIPISIPTWILGSTLIPLIGRSALAVPTATKMLVTPILPEGTLSEPTVAQKNGLNSVYAIPGLIAAFFLAIGGACLILGTRLLTNSWTTGYRAVGSTLNKGLVNPVSDDMTLSDGNDDTRGKFWKFFMGGPGLIVGGIIGFIGLLFIGAGRIFTQSWESLKRGFTSTFNGMVGKKSEITPFENDKRGFWGKFFGAPGGVLGIAFAICLFPIILAVRIITNSLLTAGLVANQLTLSKYTENNEKRTWAEHLMGTPGYFLGLAIAVVDWSFFIVLHFIKQCVLSGLEAAPYVANAALKEEKKDTNDDEPQEINANARPWYFRLLGVPGSIVGGVFGIVGFVTLGTLRIFNATVSSFIDAFKRTFKVFTDITKNNPEKSEAARDYDFDYHVLGSAGLLLGFIAGGTAGCFELLTHAVSHGWQSARAIYTSMVNVFISEKNQLNPEHALKNDTRHLAAIGILGFPGLVLGGIAGGVSILSIGTFKFIAHNFRTGARVFSHMLNATLGKNSQLEAYLFSNDQRKPWIKYLLGSLGGLAGAIIAIPCMILAFAARVISNTIKTTLEIAALIGGFETGEFSKDRTARERFGLGFAGIFSGIVFGALVLIGRILLTFASQSMITGAYAFKEVASWGTGKRAKHEPENTQSFGTFFGWGFPGLLIGGLVFGGIGFVVNAAIGLFTNSWESMKRSFVSLTNDALAENDQFPKNQGWGDEHDPRTFFGKWILGGLGWIIGGLAGTASFFTLVILRFLKHTFLSFYRTSTSFLNAALERDWFLGLDGDGRKNEYKLAGALGYILALPVGVVAGAIFAVRKSVVAIGLLFGIATAPFTLLYKAFVEKPLFSKNSANTDEQYFKELANNITPQGDFPAGGEVRPDNQLDSTQQAFKNIRKVLTFNQDTLSERLLAKIVHGYREWRKGVNPGADADPYFTSDQFTDAKEETKGFYRSKLDTYSERREMERKVDAVANMIRCYVLKKGQFALNLEGDFYERYHRPLVTYFYGRNELKSNPYLTDAPSAPPASPRTSVSDDLYAGATAPFAGDNQPPVPSAPPANYLMHQLGPQGDENQRPVPSAPPANYLMQQLGPQGDENQRPVPSAPPMEPGFTYKRIGK